MTAQSELFNAAATDVRRRAIAQHLIARLGKAASSEPTIDLTEPPPRVGRFLLFAPPLVRAIVDGRKTVTRRLITPAPPNTSMRAPKMRCPYGAPGDHLWVREKWGYRAQFFDPRAGKQGPYVYAADGAPPGAKFLPWKPSLHMPRAACRIVLKITGVRAERLKHITKEDAAAEGCPVDQLHDALNWFAKVWEQHFGARGAGWSANPWVLVIRFRVQELIGANALSTV
jgi:hypothetical protein